MDSFPISATFSFTALSTLPGLECAYRAHFTSVQRLYAFGKQGASLLTPTDSAGRPVWSSDPGGSTLERRFCQQITWCSSTLYFSSDFILHHRSVIPLRLIGAAGSMFDDKRDTRVSNAPGSERNRQGLVRTWWPRGMRRADSPWCRCLPGSCSHPPRH